MTPFLLLGKENWIALLVAVCGTGTLCQDGRAVEIAEALQVLGRMDVGPDSQLVAQRSWQTVAAQGTAERIPEILAAMNGAGPLADNWLRAAVDAIAERELREKGSLPSQLFESFTLDKKQSPRARRIAYEWLKRVDPTAPNRLLPQMLDDPSLELRYEAISQLINEANASDDEQVKLEKFQRALRSARDLPQLQKCAEALQALGQTLDMARQLGFLVDWKVIGAFDNTERAGFDKVFLPEQEIDFAAEYAGKSGPVKWRDVVSEREDLKLLGKVDLNAALAEEKSVIAYATATFEAVEETPAECRFETIEATKLWVNGKEIATKNVYHSGGGFDQYIVPCQLKQGTNRILIKVCQNEQTQPWTQPWEFRLRITDKLGGAIPQAK